MFALASSGNSVEILFSGVLAAVISGGVSLIGNHYQNKNAKNSLQKQEENNQKSLEMQKENNEASIKVQKEIANFQKDEKIFYENQLEWANSVREHLSKIVLLITQYNDATMTYLAIEYNVKYTEFKIDKNILDKQQDALEKRITIGQELLKRISVVRMLLFNDDDSYELEIEDRLNEIQNWIIQNDTIKIESVEYLITAAKKYFNNQMKQLAKKTL